MDGINKIIARINEAADAEINKIELAADEEIKKIEDDGAERIAEINEASAAEMKKEAEMWSARTESSVKSAKRSVTLSARSETVATVYRRVRERILSLSGDERLKFLSGLLNVALSECHGAEKNAASYGESIEPDSYELLLPPADFKTFGRQLVSGRNENIIPAESDSLECGLVLKSGDTYVNCSIDMIMREAEQSFDVRVREILFD